MGVEIATRPLTEFGYVSFDVVGTLIDFEGALTGCLKEIGTEVGVEVNAEDALSVYRNARKAPSAGLFPDDLNRCYGLIAAAIGLPQQSEFGRRLVEAVGEAEPFEDSVEALELLSRHYRLIAMTNARRWAFAKYAKKLGEPFWARFTADDTGTEKPDPMFFQQVFDHVGTVGGDKGQILHCAQSQYHDIGISRALGMTNVWIERRHGQSGTGGTIAPDAFTRPDYHFHKLIELAQEADRAFAS